MSRWLQWIGIEGFAWPWLLAAVLLPWVVHVVMPQTIDAGEALRVPWAGRLSKIASDGVVPVGARGFPWLLWGAWCLLCVAAARPQQLGPMQMPPQQGRDLMLAVDLSASMGEQDMELGGRPVDRLTAAKAVLADFLDRREGDRVGLLVFGDQAFSVTPLTFDLGSVRQQLGDTELGLVGRATALGDAIGLATRRLQAQPAGERVLILLTDGVNTAGVLSPDKAAEIARENKVRIHAIAFGGEGGALSMFGFRLPTGGDEVDEAGLRQVAERTGGRFYRARDLAALVNIYAEINRLEPVQRKGQAIRPMMERYPWPMSLGLGLGLLVVLRRRLRG